jgi:uncharacterized protein YjdB/Leucine-rich repeat (LRR) protein
MAQIRAVRGILFVLVAFLASYLILSCGGEGGGGNTPTQPDTPRATSVSLSPASISFDAVGATQQLTATVKDQHGSTMTGVSVSWSSSDQSVATVSSSGLVTAEDNGAASITASSGSASESAPVTVSQAVAGVLVAPAAATLTALDDTVRLTATVHDARGTEIGGETVAWHSADESIATVDGAGLTTAQARGSTTIAATAGQVSGSATVTVETNEVRIRPGGGVFLGADGQVELLVPAGAVSQTTIITVEASANPPASDRLVAETAYDFGPDGTAFQHPVQLSLGYDPGSVPAGIAEADLRLHRAEAGGWEPVDGSSVDIGARKVTGSIEGFSTYGILGASPVDSVKVSPASASVIVGGTVTFTAQTFDPDGGELFGREVTWNTRDHGIAIVDGSGLVTGMSDGVTTVTATSEGVSGSALVTVLPAEETLCSVQSEIPVAECYALVSLYDDTNGPGWTNDTGWSDTTTPCSWYGITCDGGSVTQIDLRTNGLSGPIPLDLVNLTRLTHLRLLQNQVTGTIPPELSDLPDLEWLNLNTNRLTGSIPPELGSLEHLQLLSLYSNELTGTIPPELGNLADLQYLYLDGNQLTGTIPSNLGSLSNLVHLYLYGNQLTGGIPSSLGNLATLEILDFRDNDLEGPIPSQLGNAAGLQRLYLHRNQLSGGIPSTLGNLANLRRLNLASNSLDGPIPPALGNLDNLEHLYLYSNELSGAIPRDLGNLGSLSLIWIEDNQLTDSVPLVVAQLGGKIQASAGLDQCVFAPPGNSGLTLLNTQEYRDADLDDDGYICGVPFPGGGVGEANEPPLCSNPFPPDGATGVNPISVTLSWVGSDPDGDELTYSIWWGKIPDPPLLTTGYPSMELARSDLDEGTTYYWSCKARDEHGLEQEAPVPVWRFTTSTMGLCDGFPPIGRRSTFQLVGSSAQATIVAQEVTELVAGYRVYRSHGVEDPPDLGVYNTCDPVQGEIEVATDWWDPSDPSVHGRDYWVPPHPLCVTWGPVGTSCDWTGTLGGDQERVFTEVLAYETTSVPYGTFTNAMKLRVSDYDEYGDLMGGPFIFWLDRSVGVVKMHDEWDSSTIVLVAYTPPSAPAAVLGESAPASRWGSWMRSLIRAFGGKEGG